MNRMSGQHGSDFALQTTRLELSTHFEESRVEDALTIRFRAQSDAPWTLLAVHGYSDNSHTWHRLTTMTRNLSGRLVAIDLPGHGESPFRADLARDYVDHGARLTLSLLERVAPGRPAILVANSLGGAVALRALARQVDAVDAPIRAALLLSPATPDTRRPPFVRLKRAGLYRAAEWSRRWMPRSIYRRATRFLLNKATEMALSRTEGIDPAWRDSRLDSLCRPGSWLALEAIADEVDRLLSSKDDPKTAQTWERLARIDVPVIVQRGAEDPIVGTPELLDLVARLPRAEFQELPGIGHCPQLEAPDLVESALRRLLEDSGLPS